MNAITVTKADLLKILRKNRAAHRAIFEEAIEGFRKKAISVFEKQLNLAKANKKFNAYVRLTQPQDQTSDYDRVIGMLELSKDKTIQLGENDYRAYVLDEWAWKNQFLSTNSSYSFTAASISDPSVGLETFTKSLEEA